MPYRQDPPFTLKVELTEGCNLRCTFCAMNAIRAPKDMAFKFMTPELAARIAAGVAAAEWNPRIEFTMRGEPSLNPHKETIIAAFRKTLPNVQLMMTSNGGGVVKDAVKALTRLFDAGLNIFVLDEYEEVQLATKIMRQLDAAALPFSIVRHPEDQESSPHRRWPPGTKVLVRMKDIKTASGGTHSRLNNHAGLGAPPEHVDKRCAKPFREMVVWHDGSVRLCCNDWEGRYLCGNVKTQTLSEIWQGSELMAARRVLLTGNRDFAPCQWCNDTSYRTGLLPDKMGKQTLPKPTAATRKTIAAATTGTRVVLQPLKWERRK